MVHKQWLLKAAISAKSGRDRKLSDIAIASLGATIAGKGVECRRQKRPYRANRRIAYGRARRGCFQMTGERYLAAPGGNRLLAILPPEIQRQLATMAERISFAPKEVLYEADQSIDHVWFPLSGVVSLVIAMSDGTTAEVATIGHEGLVGLPVSMGVDRSFAKAMGQIPGEALKMPAESFTRALAEIPALAAIVHRYTHAMLQQLAQSTACNQSHTIPERMCRWLLMTQDRAGADEFPLTQEFLAEMLGVQRPSVTVSAGALQKAGLIQYQRGRIRVMDRPGLEAASCECYEVVRREFDRLVV